MKLRQEALDIQTENLAQRERINQLESEAAAIAAMDFDGRVYWRDEGEKKDGPFCQRCFDENRKSIRLQYEEVTYEEFGTERTWHCRVCTSSFNADNQR